jgi:hypothetical protein
MYISPTSKNEINPSIKFYKNDEKEKESKEKIQPLYLKSYLTKKDM